MRAIFLSNGGDVLLGSFVYKLFKERFYDEVDKLWICYNNHAQVPQDAVSEYLSLVTKDPKVRLIYHPVGVGNGRPITEMVLISQEDYICLMEDDFFVFNSGALDRNFKLIEENKTDIVGSVRYTVGEVAEAAQKKYNLDYSGYGDKGMGWWPTGFFIKRKDLLRTDLDFGSKKYARGEYFKELDYTFKEDNYTDTFTWASLQLRHLGLKSIDIPHHHADPYEIQNKEAGDMNWHFTQQPFDWIHGGSLSAGWNGYLSGKLPDVSHDAAKQEMESRCAFWMIVIDEVSGFTEFRKQYREGIAHLIETTQLDFDRIDKKIQIYKELMKA